MDQNSLAYMGNRKFQYVPTVRKEPAPKASTRVFVSPKSNYTYHPAWPNKIMGLFIHPDTMAIPPSYQKLAAIRGTDLPGAVPRDTVIMFAIGGYAYSLKPNPWHWLTSKEQ